MKKTLNKYFVPQKKNNHKPHFLREKSVFVTAFMIVALFGLSKLGNYVVSNNTYLASVQSAFLIDLANEDRKDAGVEELLINEKLTHAAQMKADDMAEKGYFAHVSPEGLTPWYWIGEAGYEYLYAGENLAVNFYDSEEVEDAWMNSPTHKANILSKNFKEIGIATAKGSYKGENSVFVVQMFGTPRKVSPSINLGSLGASAGTYTNWVQRMVVSPGTLVQSLYVVITTIIIFAIILKIFVAIRKQHPKNIIYGVALLILAILFMHLNSKEMLTPVLALI